MATRSYAHSVSRRDRSVRFRPVKPSSPPRRRPSGFRIGAGVWLSNGRPGSWCAGSDVMRGPERVTRVSSRRNPPRGGTVPGQPTGTGVYSGPVRIFWKVVRWAGAAIVAVLTFVALAVWWTNPKRAVDGAFVRPAGAGVFTFADIPRGRALSPEEVDGYARRLLAEMSLEEKVLQMSGDSWTWDLLSERWIGRAWSAGADRRLRLPPLVCPDGPRGVGIGSSTCFPTPMARAASWDRSLEARVADAAAREARGQGANLWLAPCLNVLRHPRWGRAQESYGEDPYLVAEMGVAAVAG